MGNDDQKTLETTSLDELDQQIVQLMRQDGRMAFRDIAQRLEIPEATARYRVQRLLQSGVIKVLAWPDPAKLGTPNLIILWLTVEHSRIEAVAETLAKMKEVRFVAITTGSCNLVADIYFGPHETLYEFFQRLYQVPGILKCESQTVLKLLKAEYSYSLG